MQAPCATGFTRRATGKGSQMDIGEVPDDDQAAQLYDPLRTFADLQGFSDLNRSERPPLDLPLSDAA